ncbi:high-potential iron-sulfur protein [Gilvimarinus polysaccharolyticus]|uniref:high-potential iron-sulfur protein n=1 Tax=Gilvimarinus polysaccharolyticus TaxID=863921 RepID=UPI0006737D33|nr:high-potential iron-sulfur protein [Gilvimarinus polysaccharolyticus]
MKRRDFLRTSTVLAGASLIPAIALADNDLPKLSTDDTQASALKYTETSTTEGQHCNNCAHANGDLAADWVGCNIFPGKRVKGAGWCAVWAARG